MNQRESVERVVEKEPGEGKKTLYISYDLPVNPGFIIAAQLDRRRLKTT